jgi:uncharacterized spore protein YtfJ
MAFDDMMKQVAMTLERDASVRAVFGDAIKLEHHTIVPVAVVSGGGGAGGTQGDPTVSFAGGGGLALTVKPVGFISEHGDEVHFTPIHLEGPDQGLLSGATAGVRKAIDLATEVLAQALRRRARKGGPVHESPRRERRTVAVPWVDATTEDDPPPVMSPS